MEPLLHDKLNAETATLSWHELEPHFARGVVRALKKGNDLIAVAQAMAENRIDFVAQLIDSQELWIPDAHQARLWHRDHQMLWTVVIAPWILVQEVS